MPGDEGQTVYVWVDALVGYLSGVGFPGWSWKGRDMEGGENGKNGKEGEMMEERKEKETKKEEEKEMMEEKDAMEEGKEGIVRMKEGGERCAWPPDVQVVGKDIVR